MLKKGHSVIGSADDGYNIEQRDNIEEFQEFDRSLEDKKEYCKCVSVITTNLQNCITETHYYFNDLRVEKELHLYIIW